MTVYEHSKEYYAGMCKKLQVEMQRRSGNVGRMIIEINGLKNDVRKLELENEKLRGENERLRRGLRGDEDARRKKSERREVIEIEDNSKSVEESVNVRKEMHVLIDRNLRLEKDLEEMRNMYNKTKLNYEDVHREYESKRLKMLINDQENVALKKQIEMLRKTIRGKEDVIVMCKMACLKAGVVFDEIDNHDKVVEFVDKGIKIKDDGISVISDYSLDSDSDKIGTVAVGDCKNEVKFLSDSSSFGSVKELNDTVLTYKC